jgi:excisionase family DNA binding protein
MGGKLDNTTRESMERIAPLVTMDKLAVKPARAAALLDCSRTKIYDAINAGELRAVRVAGMLRISMAEIRRLLQEPRE